MEIRVEGSLDQAMRVLKRKLAKEGVFKEMKKRAFYEKPSVRRKRKRSEAPRLRSLSALDIHRFRSLARDSLRPRRAVARWQLVDLPSRSGVAWTVQPAMGRQVKITWSRAM